MKEMDMAFLVKEYGDDVFRYCKSITFHIEDAEDLYQQTYLKAFELQKKIIKENNPKAYLMSIAMNLWRNHKSQYARRERIAPTISSDEEGVQVEDVREDGDFVDKIIQDETVSKLRECVELLPEKYKQIVLLFYAAGLSIEEIARIVKIPKGTVKSRLNKARTVLKENMEAHGYGE